MKKQLGTIFVVIYFLFGKLLLAVEPNSQASHDGKCDKDNRECWSNSGKDDWKNVKTSALDNSISAEVRIRELQNFVDKNPGSRHTDYANKLIAMLEETGSIVLTDGKLVDYRNQNKRFEIFSLKAGLGILGPSLSLSFFTIVKSRFYWEILQATGTGGWILVGARGGTALGFRTRLKKNKTWEIRAGVATNIGIYYLQHEYDTRVGLVFSPEFAFIKKMPSGFGWVVGMRFPFRLDLSREKFIETSFYEDPGGGYHEWQNETTFNPLPNVCLFGGFVI